MINYEELSDKLGKKIPLRTNNLSLGMLKQMTEFMYSDAVPKDAFGNVQDFRLNKDQSKALSKKLAKFAQGQVLNALTHGQYAGNEGEFDAAMVENVARMYTGISEESANEFLKNQELDLDKMMRLSGSAGNQWKKSDESYWSSKLDQAINDDQEKHAMANYLGTAFGRQGIGVDVEKYKKGEEVYAGIEKLATGQLGRPEDFVASQPDIYRLD